MKVEANSLCGKALNFAVAKAEGHEVMLYDQLWRDNAALNGHNLADVERYLDHEHRKGRFVIVEVRNLQLDQFNPENTTPTRCAVDIPDYCEDWAYAGPIMRREKIQLQYCRDLRDRNGLYIYCTKENRDFTKHAGYWRGDHDHPLVAAMRCHVKAILGDVVEIPDVLMGEME